MVENKENISAKIDVWSIGCILSDIVDQLRKEPSKPSTGDFNLLDKLKKLSDHLPDQFIYQPSPSLISSLLSYMLAQNPSNRWTIDECLNHPVFKSLRQENEEICHEVKANR